MIVFILIWIHLDLIGSQSEGYDNSNSNSMKFYFSLLNVLLPISSLICLFDYSYSIKSKIYFSKNKKRNLSKN